MTQHEEAAARATDVPSPDLLTPGRLGALILPNRVLMAPMTRGRAGEDNVPTAATAEYYRQRATAGLIVTEGAQVSEQGVGYIGTPGIHTAAQVEGWRRVTDTVHGAGGRIFVQLWHTGRVSHPSFHDGAAPVAPSAVRPDGQSFTGEGMVPLETPRALTAEEISDVIEQFRHGARVALAAGFDGVEVHGANGYLPDQFLRDGSNRRTDAYGGSVENRARFLLEVVEAVSQIWGSDRVGVRLSPLSYFNDMFDSEPEAIFTHVAEALGMMDLAYLHVVRQNDAEGTPQDFDLSLLRRAFDGPYIINGDYDAESATQAIANDDADFVSFGRPFLANPDLPRRFHVSAPLNQADEATFYGGDELGYTDYPSLEAEVTVA